MAVHLKMFAVLANVCAISESFLINFIGNGAVVFGVHRFHKLSVCSCCMDVYVLGVSFYFGVCIM